MYSKNRKGFTLIELLIVVVIIGILAAIAIPKFANTKEKAYIASMKADLKNLATAQEAFFADSLYYFAGTASNVGGTVTSVTKAGQAIYSPSAGVTVTVTNTMPAAGVPASWSATSAHTATTKQCGIYISPAAAPNAAVKAEGEPGCW